MAEALLLAIVGLLLGVLVLQIALLRRGAGRTDGGRLEAIERAVERAERTLQGESAANRKELSEQSAALRGEVLQQLTQAAGLQRAEIGTLVASNESRFETLRKAVDERLRQIQEDNARRLEDMRRTVDEKLQGTLEKRLGESFKLVSERLEQVHKGLGEMHTLAAGVGDLKKVLTNVKTRGTWGEIQLGALLEQVLAPEQYERNVATRPRSSERVEFAIKLPGKDETEGRPVWLPIDAKFPQEDYQRLIEAADRGDAAAVEDASGRLEQRIRSCARDIREKYVNPPHTTDFGILFLPTEGLYAEVLRRAGLAEALQRELRVVVAGPTTLAALLNSLQMGFRTLAIEKRSSEVWAILGTVKNEFGRFHEILGRLQRQLEAASNTVEDAASKTRTIEGKLKKVEGLPAPDAQLLLGGRGAAETQDAAP